MKDSHGFCWCKTMPDFLILASRSLAQTALQARAIVPMTTLIVSEAKRRRSETGTRATSRHEPSSSERGQSRLALQTVRPASSRFFNDLKKIMTNTSILKFLSILHTLILPDDETCAPHDFNHNKGSK